MIKNRLWLDCGGHVAAANAVACFSPFFNYSFSQFYYPLNSINNNIDPCGYLRGVTTCSVVMKWTPPPIERLRNEPE